MSEFPAWCVPGAKVIVHQTDPIQRTTFGEIERVLKRDVVTAAGARFQSDRGRVVVFTGSGAWRRIISTMYPLSSPYAQLLVAQQRGRTVRKAMAELLKSSDSDAAVAEQLTGLLERLIRASHDQLILANSTDQSTDQSTKE